MNEKQCTNKFKISLKIDKIVFLIIIANNIVIL